MRLVVLEFENDDEANEFVDDYIGNELVGLYQVPTLFCDCDPSFRVKAGWTQGKKRGWWVCPFCKRPSQSAWKSRPERYANFGAYGFNLLEE